MKYRGEITVFLSLTIICVLSLILGLVESARTAGARLYLRMASDSAVSSVMSYYNRNLWDRYQLLFLEHAVNDCFPVSQIASRIPIKKYDPVLNINPFHTLSPPMLRR